MKTDLYTKAVLTVIAFALLCLVFQNFNLITPAYAEKLSIEEIATLNSYEYQKVILSTHNLSDTWDPIPVYIVEKPNEKDD